MHPNKRPTRRRFDPEVVAGNGLLHRRALLKFSSHDGSWSPHDVHKHNCTGAARYDRLAARLCRDNFATSQNNLTWNLSLAF